MRIQLAGEELTDIIGPYTRYVDGLLFELLLQ